MSRTVGVLALFVLVALVSFAGYPVAQVAQQPAGSTLAPAPEDSSIVQEALTCEMSSPSTSEETAACSRCPDGSPQCWGDKQCDTFCGGKGLGACVRINSCYKCCSCLA
jgi:hypothetical protein